MTKEKTLPPKRHEVRTWLINLPRATERRRKMDEQLANLPLDHKVFDGVDGSAREAELITSVDVLAFERNMGRKILMGGIGCYHSHLGVWREFIDTEAPVALVLEDDVVFHDDFISAIDLALTAIDRWDMLKLNSIRAKLPVSQGKIGPYTLNAYVGPATGTGAYLIKRETVEKLLPRMLPITRATDHEINLFFVHEFRLIGLEPFPSHVDDGNISFITGIGSREMKKFIWYRRLPNYWLRASNYWRRFVYLARTGAIPGFRMLSGKRDKR